MLSKIKNLKGGTGFIAGLLIAMLLIPSVAVAAGLRFTGIEGTSKNKADVTAGGQLLTTNVAPSNIYQSAQVNLFSPSRIVLAPTTNAIVVTTLHLDVSALSGSSGTVTVFAANGSCGGTETFSMTVQVAAIGEIDVPFGPGLPIAAGDALCAGPFDATTQGQASGYLVPASEVP